jgi:hypothetical protein
MTESGRRAFLTTQRNGRDAGAQGSSSHPQGFARRARRKVIVSGIATARCRVH